MCVLEDPYLFLTLSACFWPSSCQKTVENGHFSRFPKLLRKTTDPIFHKSSIYPQGVFLKTPIYFLPCQHISGPLVAKKQFKNCRFSGFPQLLGKTTHPIFCIPSIYTQRVGLKTLIYFLSCQPIFGPLVAKNS